MKSGVFFVLACMGVGTGYAQEKTGKSSAADHHLKDVVITGQYAPQSLRNSVYQTRIISAEKIRLRAATNLQQVLSTELGFRFSNDMTLGTSNVQLMGMDGRNVKVLLDGVSLVDRNDTRESLNQIDINTIERIEIVEGPLSVSYGSDALAGVINIITKKPGKETLSINARVQEETVGKEYSPFSNEGQHIQHLGGSWQKKGFSVLAGLTHNDFGGFNAPEPLEEAASIAAESNRWKPKEQWMANTKLGYSNDKFNVWYRMDYANEHIYAQEAYNPGNFKALKAEYVTNRYTQQVQGDYRFSERLQWNAVAAFSNLQRRTITNIHDYSTGEETLSTAQGTQDMDKFRSATFRSTLQYKLSDRVSFQPGIDINIDHSDGARISGTPTINDYAFFISSEIELLKGLVLRPGLRFISNSVYDAPPAIPSLNTKIRLNEKLDLRFGYANGFRSPALRELYYNFVDASHKIYGNENLKAETSDSFNASLTLTEMNAQATHFRSVLNGFYNIFHDRIDYAVDTVDPTATTLLNINTYKTTGGTWENTVFSDNFQFSLGFSVIGTYNQYSENAAQYGETPEFVWTPEVNSNLSYTFKKLGGTTVNLAYKFLGRKPVYQLIAADGTHPEYVRLAKTGSFSMADLMFTKKIGNSLTLNAGVNNLLNVTTVSNTAANTGVAHSSGEGPVIMNYGRSYVLGLNFNWTKK
ncbi:TonB-dependent receptor plug domain-containing protein [Pedobacter sp. AW31-3R]|uniref:TonB-dependent receptor plug domain-containing protein n=1 Tax=Pedobacter sp. AW31-3R TaxID=3445781 RepID=UPI003FA09A20